MFERASYEASWLKSFRLIGAERGERSFDEVNLNEA